MRRLSLRIRTRRIRGLQTPPVSWLGGLERAAFPPGWPFRRQTKKDPAGQWLARVWRRLTVARRRRFHTVFPNAEFAGGCGWTRGAASTEPRHLPVAKKSWRTGMLSAPRLVSPEADSLIPPALNVDARASRGSRLDLQRRLEHLLEQ